MAGAEPALALEKLNFAIQNKMLNKMDKFDEKAWIRLANTGTPKLSGNRAYEQAPESSFRECKMTVITLEAERSKYMAAPRDNKPAVQK